MLRQILKTLKLLGPARAVRMKKHHDQGLRYVRGYAATCCFWALMKAGLLDALQNRESVELSRFAEDHGLEPEVLDAVIEYLDGIGLVARRGDRVALTKAGRALADEPRGLFELLYAYEPCFTALDDLLAGKRRYGGDLTRRVTYVGIGSGRLCEQLPYPVMREMVLRRHCRMVLDLGCGDLAFLAGLCREDPDIRGHGIDIDAGMITFNQERLARQDYHGRLSCQQADMFDLSALSDELPPVDAVTACDTFHEYLDQPERIVTLLRQLRERFPQAVFIIGEFCLQDAEWLRKHPTASLEHHLFHRLSGQQIGTAAQWHELFTQAGLRIEEENVFDLIGHGYFALR